MPTIELRITCQNCGEEYEPVDEGVLPELEEYIGICSICHGDVCKKCNGSGDESDLSIHTKCKENEEWDKDE